MAITKKHSELSGSSLHNPKGITVTPTNTVDSLLKLDVTNKIVEIQGADTIVQPESPNVVSLGTQNRYFKDIYISGDIKDNTGAVWGGSGGSGGTGIFGLDQTGTVYTSSNDINITGSLRVKGTISGSIDFSNLSTDGNIYSGGTITASAFFVTGSGNGGVGYFVTASMSQSNWMTGSGTNVYREFGNVGIGTNNPTSTLTVVGDVDINEGDLILDDNKQIKNALYNEPFLLVKSGSLRSVSVGLRGGNPSVGYYNVIMGDSTAETLDKDSYRNVIIGFESAFQAKDLDKNVIIGSEAGYNLQDGKNNVFIGNAAGKNAPSNTTSRFYLSNTDTKQPLLYGNFNTNQLGVNVVSGTLASTYTNYNLVVSGNQHITNDINIVSSASANQFGTNKYYLLNSNPATRIQLTSNIIDLFPNGTYSYINIDGTTKAVTINPDNENIDTVIKSDIGTAIHAEGQTNQVGIGTSSPTRQLSVGGMVDITGDTQIGGNLDMTGSGGHLATTVISSSKYYSNVGTDTRAGGAPGFIFNQGINATSDYGVRRNGIEYVRPDETGSFLTATGSMTLKGDTQTWLSETAYKEVEFFVSGNVDITGEFLKNGAAFYTVDERGTILGEHSSGFLMKSGSENTLVGYFAGNSLNSDPTLAHSNVVIGDVAGQAIGNSSYNVLVGKQAGYNIGHSNKNTIIGALAGGITASQMDITGSIFIGYKAGFGSSGSQAIVIGNEGSEVQGDHSALINLSGSNIVSQNNAFVIRGAETTTVESNSKVGNFKVGIGTVSPRTALEISGSELTELSIISATGSSTSTGSLLFGDDAYNKAGRIEYHHLNNDFVFKNATGNAASSIERMRLTSSGSLALGLSDTNKFKPEGTLHISSSTDPNLFVENNDGSSLIRLKRTDNNKYFDVSLEGNDIRFIPNTQDKTSNVLVGVNANSNRIDSFLGVGSATPTSQLTVNISSSKNNDDILKDNIGALVKNDIYNNVGYTGYGIAVKPHDGNVATASLRITRTAGTRFFGTEITSKAKDGFRILVEPSTTEIEADPAATLSSEKFRIDESGKAAFSQTSTNLSTLTSSFQIFATDNLIIPFGTTAQRGFGGDDTKINTGSIRYNTDLVQYEGYDGNHWGSLGGVIDVDRDTYIRAESPLPNTDNDSLDFVVEGAMMMNISASGDSISNNGIGIAPYSASAFGIEELLHVSGGAVRFENSDGNYYKFGEIDTRTGLEFRRGSGHEGSIRFKNEDPQGMAIGVAQDNRSVNIAIGDAPSTNTGGYANKFTVWNTKIGNALTTGKDIFWVSGSGVTYVSTSLGINTTAGLTTGGSNGNAGNAFGVKGNSLFDGNVDVTGIVTAKEIHTTYESASISFTSGSNKLGDTPDDVHHITGSIHSIFSASANSSAHFANPTHHFLGNLEDLGNVGFGIGTKEPGQKIGNTYNAWTANERPVLEISGSHPSLVINGMLTSSLFFGDWGGTGAHHKVFGQKFNDGTASFGKIDSAGTQTNTLNIFNNGQVGIGTMTPETTFDVNGDLTIGEKIWTRADGNRNTWIGSGVDYWSFGAAGTGASSQMLKLSHADGAVFNEPGGERDFRIEGDTKTHLFFVSGSTDRIGLNTNAPGAFFDIHQPGTNNTDGIRLVNSSGKYTSVLYAYDSDGTKFNMWKANEYSTAPRIQLDSNGVSYISGSGKVGIGTISPSALLSIESTTVAPDGIITATDKHHIELMHTSSGLTSTDDETGPSIAFSSNYNNGGATAKTTRAAIRGGTQAVGANAGGFLGLYTNVESPANQLRERVRIHHDGKVSITNKGGQSAPSASADELTISGSVSASHYLHVGKGVNITSNSGTELIFSGNTYGNIAAKKSLYLLAGQNGTDASDVIYFGSGGTNSQMTLRSGSLGIGVSPAHQLHISQSHKTSRTIPAKIETHWGSVGGYPQLLLQGNKRGDSNTIDTHLELKRNDDYRGAGIKITEANTTDEWFVGAGYKDEGFHIGYDDTGQNESERPESSSLMIKRTGKIGIGTRHPSEKLEVFDGNISLSGSSNYIRIQSDGAEYAQLMHDTSDNQLKITGWSGTKIMPSSNSANALEIEGQSGQKSSYLFGVSSYGSNQDIMYVSSSGRVGIGTTSPEYKLDVDGNIRARGSITVDEMIISSSTTYVTTSYSEGSTEFGDSPSADTHRISGSLYVTGSFFNLTPNGRLGLGTDSPDEVLHIEGSAGNKIKISSTDSTYETWTLSQGNSGLYWNLKNSGTYNDKAVMGMTDDGRIHIYGDSGFNSSGTTNAGYVVFDSDKGYVRIGSGSHNPDNELEVLHKDGDGNRPTFFVGSHRSYSDKDYLISMYDGNASNVQDFISMRNGGGTAGTGVRMTQEVGNQLSSSIITKIKTGAVTSTETQFTSTSGSVEHTAMTILGTPTTGINASTGATNRRGYVGIGTTSPQKRLHVQDSGILISGGSGLDTYVSGEKRYDSRFVIDTGGSINHQLMNLMNNSGSVLYIKGDAAGVASTEGSRLGKVGINMGVGEISTSYTGLEVSGSSRFKNNLTINEDLDVDGAVHIGDSLTGTGTLSYSSGITTLTSFPKATWRTAKLVVSAKANDDSQFHSSEVLVTHDGTDAYITTYAIIDSGTTELFKYTAAVDGANIRVYVENAGTASTVKYQRTLIVV